MNAQVTALVVRRAQAEIIRPFGIAMAVMGAAAQTGGACSVLLGELKPGEGPPPHLHHEFDEYFFVLDGVVSLVVAGRQTTVSAGDLIFTPRNTVHSFKNAGASAATLLEWTVPGGNEPYFRAVYELEATGSIDPQRLAEINARFATEFLEG